MTKKDVKALRKEQRGLRHLQDQKIDGLADQVNLMGEVFEIQRAKREALKKLYYLKCVIKRNSCDWFFSHT